MIEQRKRSFAEKISRTLDKIAAVTARDPEPRREILPAPIYPVYPGYHPGYRTVRGPHGVNYQYVYGGWDPGVYGFPVEYISTPPPPHPLSSRSYCRCPESGKDSVRSRPGSRCRKCNLERFSGFSSQALRKTNRPKLPMSLSPSPESRPTYEFRNRRPSPGPRDPYDYIRRTRLKADEWDTYWDQTQVENQLRKQTKNNSNPSHGHSTPTNELKNERTERTSNQDTVKHSLSALSCEDEDPEPESKPISNSARSVEIPNSNPGDKNLQSEEAGSTDPESLLPENTTGEEIEDEPDVFADLVSMKSRLTAAEVRYRKYQRRKPLRKVALQLEDVIIEESEDDLAADSNEEIYFSLPTLEEDCERSRSSSDDELGLGKFKVVSTNFADEILSEIYGNIGSPGSWRDASLSPRSMADEILQELYGTTGDQTYDKDEEENDAGGYGMEAFNPNLVKLSTEPSCLQESRGLQRSISLQERGRAGLGHLFQDTTRFKLGRTRSSLIHLVPSLAPLPGTPTLHRPRIPPPPPPVIEPNLSPFSPLELDRINTIIRRTEQDEFTRTETEQDDFSEFSEDEFDPVGLDYENIPLERAAPDGAEAGPEYDIPELNESTEDIKFELNLSIDSCESRLLDISEDSLNIPKLSDTSFDRDSIVEESSQVSSGSVIHKEGEKTIIRSPGMIESNTGLENRVYISSSSWINIESGSQGSNFVSSTEMGGDTEEECTLEPVKPPRLKKIARQQSKQELLRAKGFGLNLNKPEDETAAEKPDMSRTRVRPEISSPVLINSTMNPDDLENHKCIPLSILGDISHLTESVYRSSFSESEGSFYTLESILDETYRSTGSDIYNEHIYEEIQDNKLRIRPLPPIPEGSAGSGSIFTGATKSEILHFLNDAKLRLGGGNGSGEVDSSAEEHYTADGVFLGVRNNKHRISAISNISDSSNSSNDSSGDGSVQWRGPLEKIAGRVDIERNDSGVGSDSGISNSKISTSEIGSVCCRDCEFVLVDEENLCSKCSKRRTERKEIINEIVETEIKYGNDLRIIVDEFYRPMLVAGLLTAEQLSNIFLNVNQLISVNSSFSALLKEAVDLAQVAEDEDLCSVDIGSIFLDSLSMLQAFEAYCTRQAASSMLLSSLEREKELLRVFLKVSQMENKILRRMNLSSFLMVPVQRVTKYPLLLSRLLKVTPSKHMDREKIRQAQTRIESALEQMNKDAKEIISMKGTWRRPAGKKVPMQREMNNIRVRKLSLEMLGWGREESRFALEGKLTFAHVTDTNWRNKWKGTVNTGLKLVTCNAFLVVTGRIQGELQDMSSPTQIIFPREHVREAVLLLLREKTSRFSTVRDPIYLGKTVISNDAESEWFEVQEFGSKDSYLFKAEDAERTQTWFQTVQLYSQSLGGWRRRRRGLANIMVDPGTH